MTNYTDYTDELEIEEGDKLTVQSESDVSDAFNGELEITARSGLGSKTICDKEGFEHETRGDEVDLELANGKTVQLQIRQSDLFDDRDDVIAKVKMAGHSQPLAKITSIEVN